MMLFGITSGSSKCKYTKTSHKPILLRFCTNKRLWTTPKSRKGMFSKNSINKDTQV